MGSRVSLIVPRRADNPSTPRLPLTLTDVAQIERRPVANEHQPAQPSVCRGGQAGVGVDHLLGVFSSFFDQGGIPLEIRNAKGRQAVLPSSKQFARTSEREIDLSELETVG